MSTQEVATRRHLGNRSNDARPLVVVADSTPVTAREKTAVPAKRGRVAVVRHGEYFQSPHPRRDIFALRDAGFDVDVICDAEGGKPHLELVDGVTVIRLPIRHKRGKMGRYLFEYVAFPILAAGALAARSIRHRYDYVEIDTMPTWLIASAVVPKLLGAKVVLYMFEHMAELAATDRGLNERHWLIRFIDSIEMVCVRSADRVLTPAERNRELYIQRGIPPHKIVFIPNCPDEGMFLPTDFAFPRPPRSSRPGSNGTARPFRLVTHGSLLERYGIQILIEAVARLKPSIPELELDIIGSGEFEPNLMVQANTLGIADSVRFIGPVQFEQMAAKLLEADIGVGPYLLDLLPNKMMEYLVLGIPAIAADWPTMRRYFGDDAITYVRPNDVEELMAAIQTLYLDPGLRAQQAMTAHRQYVDSLAWSRARHTYLSVYGVESSFPAIDTLDSREVPDISPRRRRGWLSFVLGQSRGPRNALTRLPTILSRFGFSARKSTMQLDHFLAVTDKHKVTPTILVTGVTARRHPEMILELGRRGVEIGAHGFVHNDYSQLTHLEQVEQVGRARNELAALGLKVHGWRCPYSRSNEHTLDAVRQARLAYDATPVFEWPAFDAVGVTMTSEVRADYERLRRLFGVRDAGSQAVLPRLVNGLVEIPMSIPQDEDMIDRLHLDGTKCVDVWLWMVNESRRVGEAFVICLHPERAELMAGALDATLARARELSDVWIVPLKEIAEWWTERAAAQLTISRAAEGRWTVCLKGSDRVVARLGAQTITGAGMIEAESSSKPVVGLSNLWPNATQQRIQECGYLCEMVEPGMTEFYLDDEFSFDTRPEVIVRALQGCTRITRLEPWPVSYRSCLSISGDIDALTLFDFAMRLQEFS
jgi:glycosyltransferase involved in cell wall biosynthesis/peptidoglycan/xylan/chitin deacetylase (PgdA/CDA1 family)